MKLLETDVSRAHFTQNEVQNIELNQWLICSLKILTYNKILTAEEKNHCSVDNMFIIIIIIIIIKIMNDDIGNCLLLYNFFYKIL